MMRLVKILVAVGLTSALCTGFAATKAPEKTLTFATEATYPPFVSMSPNGQMVGADADLVRALCNVMHRQCELINAPWDSLIPSLQVGKYDAIFGGLAITPDREKVVSFTKAYYDNTAAFVTVKGKPFVLSAAGLAGKTIGVQSGTTFQKYMQAKYSNANIKSYDSDMQALLDLQSGRLDAVFLDAPVAALWMKDHPSANLVIASQIIDPTFFGVGNGIAVQKGNTQLLNALNHAITVVLSNGTYAKIKSQYFNVNQ